MTGRKESAIRGRSRFDISASLTLRIEEQSTDRAYRIGQNKPVYVYIPIAIHPKYGDSSFDENLHRLLTKKRSLSINALLPGTVTDSEFNDLYTQTVNS